MRRTNKKVMKKTDDKKGVILVTVIFIVAMALLFITTALTISIASRHRVYSNAKSDQARLTVTSLAQSIWQAIYSQQINDAMLNYLADGTAGNGSYVTFTSNAVPGMGAGGTESSAYFYRDSEDPERIIIECKCSIDGVNQYYRMVLTKEKGEGLPRPMFNMTVELGNPGMLNAFNFGVDASQITQPPAGSLHLGQHSWEIQQRYWHHPGESDLITDNVVFLHGDGNGVNTTSNQGGSGFYCDVISTGHTYLRDPVFAGNVLFVGENAVFDFTSTSQTGMPTNESRGDIYFWGTNMPFLATDATINMNTFNNINFAYRDVDDSLNANSTGFNATYRNSVGGVIDAPQYGNAGNSYLLPGYTGTDGGGAGTVYGSPWNISGSVNYESGTGAYLRDATAFGDSSEINIPATLLDYLDIDDGVIDTIAEVKDKNKGYGTHTDHPTATEITEDMRSLDPGYYYIDQNLDINYAINCNVTNGPITIYVYNNAKVSICGDGSEAGFFINGPAEADNYVNFVLEENSEIDIASRNSAYASGLVDPRCFNSGTSYTDVHNLDQTQFPRFFVFAAYTKSDHAAAMTLGDTGTNGGAVCTAFLGFYPSTPGGSDGAGLALNNVNAGTGIVYYGRISAGNLGNGDNNGGNLNVPYCPGIPGSLDDRDTAYRDLTDYSVVTEDSGYFMTSNR